LQIELGDRGVDLEQVEGQTAKFDVRCT